jgi:2-polyprenyl-6-methoxyphenol hydroxylase-like FAD-dependent oxidoreductase
MLGDAVHATLPYMAQGAAMAIEDAAVLARALDELPGPLPNNCSGTTKRTARRAPRAWCASPPRWASCTTSGRRRDAPGLPRP